MEKERNSKNNSSIVFIFNNISETTEFFIRCIPVGKYTPTDCFFGDFAHWVFVSYFGDLSERERELLLERSSVHRLLFQGLLNKQVKYAMVL